MTDVALDPYTSHGRDGVLDDSGYILNDETVEVCAAGAHPGPGRAWTWSPQRHDGRAHRRHPRGAGGARPIHTHHGLRPSTPAPSTGRSATPWARQPTWARRQGRTTRWTRPAATGPCAKVALDIAEGADMVIVKPGMPYLDIVLRRVKDEFTCRPCGPGVGRVRHAQGRRRQRLGWTDAVMLEALLAFKRAGCRRHPDLLALDAARLLRG